MERGFGVWVSLGFWSSGFEELWMVDGECKVVVMVTSFG